MTGGPSFPGPSAQGRAALHVRALVPLAGLVGLASCSLMRPLDDLEGAADPLELADGALATASDAGHPHFASCNHDTLCGSGRCLEEEGRCEDCPSEMQRVRFADGQAFCMDEREATRREYDAFLLALERERPVLELQNTEVCPAAENFEPRGGANCQSAYMPGGDSELPMVCVDLCDAMAYCAWRGKRLCGGRGGQMISRAELNDPANDEWFTACTGGTGRKYPYGPSYESVCNVNGARVEAAADFRDCQTPDHIAMLSGNVAEWVLICRTTPNGIRHCLVRGGEYRTSDTALAACTFETVEEAVTPRRALEPAERGPGVGIRCCAD